MTSVHHRWRPIFLLSANIKTPRRCGRTKERGTLASKHTEHYGLNQWEASDQVLHSDFNEDNVKIETAISVRNCQIYTTTYVGTGTIGRTYIFPHKPIVVFVTGDSNTFIRAVQGSSSALVHYNFEDAILQTSWDGNTLQCSNARAPALAADFAGWVYTVTALLDPDQ